MKTEQVYAKVLEIAKRIARTKDGTLFIIAPKNKFRGMYKLLYTQIIPGCSINEKGIIEVIEKICLLDGAVLISNKGELVAYGVMIKKTKPLRGYGTKHAAAAGFTHHVENSTAVLVSEGSDWIRVFQNGKIIMEMDSSEQSPSMMNKIVSFLTDKDTALITAAGASTAIVGFAPVLVLTGTYLVIKTASGIIKKNLESLRK